MPSNPSDPETPRERAERVLREHTQVIGTVTPVCASTTCVQTKYQRLERAPWPCLPVLLARDVIALSDRLKYEPDWERAAHDYRAKAEKAEAALAEAQAEAKKLKRLKRADWELQSVALRGLEAENQRLREHNASLVRGANRLRCPEHQTDATNAWGCPVCVSTLRDDLKRLRETVEKHASLWHTINVYNSAEQALRELGLWKEPGE